MSCSHIHRSPIKAADAAVSALSYFPGRALKYLFWPRVLGRIRVYDGPCADRTVVVQNSTVPWVTAAPLTPRLIVGAPAPQTPAAAAAPPRPLLRVGGHRVGDGGSEGAEQHPVWLGNLNFLRGLLVALPVAILVAILWLGTLSFVRGPLGGPPPT